jgi:predicted Zn finger-like uncharacterized protein
MILTCPSCGTQYVVKDGTIPPAGRQVRCASCKHSWHQDPDPAQPAIDPAEDAMHSVPETTPEPDLSSSEPEPETATGIDNDLREQGSEAAEDDREEDPAEAKHETHSDVAPEAAPGGWFPEQDDEFAPFGARDEPEERRGRSALSKILLLILLVAASVAAFWFLAPPELKARLGLAQSGASPLQLMLTHSQRQELASGNILLAVTGRVINPTDEVQRVPPIQAELRKTSGELVYSWTISPPARSIPPGGRAPFNSAEMNVPPEGDLLTITFRSNKA